MYDNQKMQDIKYSELSIKQQYDEYWNSENIIGLNNVLTQQNNALKRKIFNAYNWNRLLNLINDEFNLQDWDSTKNYQKYDMVKSGTNYYLCIEDNTNQSVSNTDYWVDMGNYALVEKILTSDSLYGLWENLYTRLQNASADFIYKDEWQSGINYAKNNLVSYNGCSYYCILGNTSSDSNQPPNSTYWLLAFTNIPVESSQPTNLITNQLWLEEIEEGQIMKLLKMSVSASVE